jgi:hypothetical protein
VHVTLNVAGGVPTDRPAPCGVYLSLTHNAGAPLASLAAAPPGAAAVDVQSVRTAAFATFVLRRSVSDAEAAALGAALGAALEGVRPMLEAAVPGFVDLRVEAPLLVPGTDDRVLMLKLLLATDPMADVTCVGGQRCN